MALLWSQVFKVWFGAVGGQRWGVDDWTSMVNRKVVDFHVVVVKTPTPPFLP